MTRVLVLGGTAWLGRRIAGAWLREGASVTCLARGSSGAVPEGATLVVADRDMPDAYAGVLDEPWDEIVEISRIPAHVSDAVHALSATAAHWTFVSTVSVYADHDQIGADETARLLDADDLENYGKAKVAAEIATAAVVGDRLAIIRPGLIGGAGDVSDRCGYWVSRYALAGDGPVLVPEATDRWVQVIDVDDLAAAVVAAGRSGFVGTVNAVGDPHRLGDVLSLAAQTAGFTGTTVTASDEELLTHDVGYWAGERSLPLWLPADAVGFARRSNAAFHAQGWRLTPLAETMRTVLDDEHARGLDRSRRAGLTREDELALLATLER